MKKLERLWPLMAMALVAIGCQSDNNNPVATAKNNVMVTAANDYIVAPTGSEAAVPLSALVTDENGRPVADVTVTFAMGLGEGTFVPPSVKTDNAGNAKTELHVTVGKNYEAVIISALTAGGGGSLQMQTEGTGQPSLLMISTTSQRVFVARGQNGRIVLNATVVDSSGVALADVPLSYRLEQDGDTPIFGALSSGAGKGNGGIAITFDSRGGSGREKVMVSTDFRFTDTPPVTTELPIEVAWLEDQIASLTLTPTVIGATVGEDSVVQQEVTAQVIGANHHPLQDIMVAFSATLGSVEETAVTDENGLAKVTYTCQAQTGTGWLSALVPGTGFADSAKISINPEWVVGTLNLMSDVTFIYSDNGVTVAHLTAVLRNQDNVAVAGKWISFVCSFGAVNAAAVTDTLGIARAIFTDLGMPSLDEHGIPIPVWIKARYREGNVTDSVGVTIRPGNPFDHITLTCDKPQLQAGSPDSATFSVTCFMLSGDYAPAGTIVRFISNPQTGSFSNDVVPTGQYGHAEVYYKPGQLLGPVTIHAEVMNRSGIGDTIIASNDVVINLLTGPPAGGRIDIEPIAGGSWQITATITDAYSNPVQGVTVDFNTTKGYLTRTSAVTDSAGKARSILSSDGMAGIAEVTISFDSPTGPLQATRTITFFAGLPHRIELTGDPKEIDINGYGEDVSSTLSARVFDANNNPVETATRVVFQILNNPDPPLGCDINHHGSIDSALTANGVALASLNSGTQVGGVIVRAYTWADPDSASAGPDGILRTDTVSVIYDRIMVVGGPPYAFRLDVDSRGEDAGGGVWEVEVSARAFDLHLNPVADGIPVIFTVQPDDIATIDAGTTGNLSRSGRSSPGVAYSILRYNSHETFDSVAISAGIQAPAGEITNEILYQLPLQRGRIILAVNPQNFMFSLANGQRMGQADTCNVRVWATVRDGHDMLINNAPILFTSDRAHFYWMNQRLNRYNAFAPNPARKLTGVVNNDTNEPPGVATVFLRGWMNDFYLDDFTLEVSVHLQAAVDGYDDVYSEPVTFFCTRH